LRERDRHGAKFRELEIEGAPLVGVESPELARPSKPQAIRALVRLAKPSRQAARARDHVNAMVIVPNRDRKAVGNEENARGHPAKTEAIAA
jgi:hypothetical protein